MTDVGFGRLVTVTAKQTLEESPHSVIGFAREHINLSPVRPHEPERITARNSKFLIVDDDSPREDHFKEKLSRKKENAKCGFFSSTVEPYKCLGDIELNSRALTLKQLVSDWQPSQVVFHTKRTRKPKAKKLAPESKLVLTDSGQEIRTSVLRHLDKCENGGLSSIKKNVAESYKRISAVKGGMPYIDIIKAGEEAKAREEAMKLDKGSRLVMKKLSQEQVKPRSQDLLSSVISQTEHHEPHVLEKKMAAVKEKLVNVNFILCSIHNMRPKDLKTRVALKPGILKTLRLEPTSSAADSRMRSHAGRLRSTLNHSSMEATPITPSRHITGGSSFAKRQLFGSKLGSRVKNMTPSEAAPRIETWEDLLYAVSNRPDSSRRMSSWKRTSVSLKKKLFIDAQEAAKKALGIDAQVANRRAPLWQSIHAQERACFNTLTTPKTAESGHSVMADTKVDGLLDDLKTKLLHIKYQKHNEVTRYLAHLESERIGDFHRKFTAFRTLSPLYERQKAKMDYLARSTMLPTDSEKEEKETQHWFKILEEASGTLLADEELTETMKKLGKFAKDDVRLLPHAKDYLCLLLMSYPAVDLVNVAVQQAFKFVWMEILGGRVELYQFWMSERGIPVEGLGSLSRPLTTLHSMRQLQSAYGALGL